MRLAKSSDWHTNLTTRSDKELQSTFAAYSRCVANHWISVCAYRSYYRQLMKRLDKSDMNFNGLRHTFATRCIESKCDYKMVFFLGHSNIRTTLNRYVYPNM